MPAELWAGCLVPASQQEPSPSLLCIPFKARLPAWLGAPIQRGMRSSIQPLEQHSTEHTTAHTSAGTYDSPRNGREHSLVQLESVLHNFQ